ncbi:MAG: 30S ribosomal protein S9 [Candidatus Magasanikbacteria bacterium CG10_big_fil_rev_8_21_14_0_10_43_6]|uniref:30S ribosomal protein S9 n=1 Tax=Candidatus Magasanikbacteria bacterium CG10_big_fil_rev_8_21_14_0_10_43_6 TaxID=1974650 RepID=A0A2M6W1C2_9BACT|nr:MAG: 30S ribosomal protein S9 [Candidatus Magasanikbacteria bacterium CG10_big_fil_rev_8_21_14_0_10_43_6]
MERAVGRRKTSAARVRLMPGKGNITINDKAYKVFFPITFWQEKVEAPLAAVGRTQDFDISIKVSGGGVNSQAEAIRHGISRALVMWDELLRPVLKAEGFLTRDPRAKERKKPGQHRARRGHQWRKR